ncbi:uncharacterized protein METZ01_LOCUS149938 [marine metagenome]|uniref:Uncharacterized protein n=1 Tax=marine metagenome TaxID=408172 RepID=A0A382A6M7_9ZZZZ
MIIIFVEELTIFQLDQKDYKELK